VSSENKHAFATRLGRHKMFQPLCADPVARILGRIPRHAAELDKLPAQVNVNPPQNSLSGFLRELWQGKLKIPHACASQSPEAPIDPERNATGKNARDATWQAAQAARDGYNQPILEVFTHE
jgi:hypothetical protein